MIEIIDMQDKPEKLEITPQLAIAALNTLIDYCRGPSDCENCVFNSDLLGNGEGYCEEHFLFYCPCFMDRIELPAIDGNTVTYFEGDELHRTTCGNRQEAEELLERKR